MMIQALLHNAEVWVAVGFVIFVVFAFKPSKKAVTAALDGHIDKIKAQLQEAERLHQEALAMFEEAKAQQAHIFRDVEEIHARCEAEIKTMRSEALKEADRIITLRRAEADARIVRSELEAEAVIHEYATELVMTALKQVLINQSKGAFAAQYNDQSIGQIERNLH